MELEYLLPNGKSLKISEAVLKLFHKYRQRSFRIPESGGILLGGVRDQQIIVDKATIPGRGDKQGTFFFHRHRARAQALVNKVFLSSNGRQIYVGEWHTHTQTKPRASFIDRFEIKRAFRKSHLNLEFIILIVVGNLDKLGNIWIGYYDGQIMKECRFREGGTNYKVQLKASHSPRDHVKIPHCFP